MKNNLKIKIKNKNSLKNPMEDEFYPKAKLPYKTPTDPRPRGGKKIPKIP